MEGGFFVMLLKFAIQDFLEDRRFKNLSPTTVKGYELFFKTFENYCSKKEIIDLDEITANTIKGFLLYLKNDKNNNPTSLNTKLKNLKSFFNYLVQEEILTEKRNPTLKLSYVKETIKIETFTDEQIKQILNYFKRLKNRDRTFYSVRDYTICIFLLGTGVRLGELINLRWKDINFESSIVTVIGKKRDYSSIPMSERLRKEMREYRIFCDRYFEELPEYVFTDNQGQQLTDNAIKNMFKRLKGIMNFKDVRLSCHTFRHTFAQRCLMAGMDVFTLQKLLRHKKLEMTERYLALWGTALSEQNEKYNPLNGLNL